MNAILGAIVAGGASRRFGSDKAEALWRGGSLLDHTIAALGPQVAALAIVGRDHPGCVRLDDRPPGCGPIAGIAAALHHAAAHGHTGALCVPVDVHPLPGDLPRRLCGERPAVFADQHMIGWWPADLSAPIQSWIAAGGRSLRGWIAACDARLVSEPPGLININTPSDLARLPR